MNKSDTITINVEAGQIIPMAEECLKEIKSIRDKEDLKRLTNFMTYYNSHWYNKLFKKSIKSIDEAREYKDEEQNRSMYGFPWRCMWHWEVKNNAMEILEHFKHDIRNKKSVYNMPVKVYNEIAGLCKTNGFSPYNAGD